MSPKTKQETFRELVDRCRAYADPCRRPRSMAVMAERCGLSRPHLYNLMLGNRTAPSHTRHKIAQGLGVTFAEVSAALDATELGA